MIVNNAVLRTDLSGEPAFEELVSRAMRVAVGAYALTVVAEALRISWLSVS